ncbi:MAG: hypothetical protein B6230_04935 [Desulfobacteraceae bacterium 4572_89]|nr:MAG: hypothetical protein B6230_04935 [Desulfobacteraceae bacterium 4572_89]
METHFACLPCFMKQTIDAACMVIPEKKEQEKIFRQVLKAISEMDFQQSPPEMAQYIHREIQKISGCHDPYKELKTKYNQYALDLYPAMKEKILNSPNQFETAVRLAIAGNIIDFGASLVVDQAMIKQTIQSSFTGPLMGNTDNLFDAISLAKKILFLGDNTGEIVFDRLLIEILPMDKVIYSVRGMPILNDATMEDAVQTGMTQKVKVIHNGSDAPGTILKDCSKDFLKVFDEADLVISKGQGNFETLSHVDKNIYFLLKAKCHVIAAHIGCNTGTSIAGRPSDFKKGPIKVQG